jgi:hypothetical protein
MLMRKTLLAGLAVGALAMPLLAAAQSWGGGDYNRGSGYGYRNAFRGYPQFQGAKAHIRAEIRQGVSEGWLDSEQAQDMYRSLQQEQWQETREFRAHGWNLPSDDQEQLRDALDEIDQSIDQARDEGDQG